MDTPNRPSMHTERHIPETPEPPQIEPPIAFVREESGDQTLPEALNSHERRDRAERVLAHLAGVDNPLAAPNEPDDPTMHRETNTPLTPTQEDTSAVSLPREPTIQIVSHNAYVKLSTRSADTNAFLGKVFNAPDNTVDPDVKIIVGAEGSVFEAMQLGVRRRPVHGTDTQKPDEILDITALEYHKHVLGQGRIIDSNTLRINYLPHLDPDAQEAMTVMIAEAGTAQSSRSESQTQPKVGAHDGLTTLVLQTPHSLRAAASSDATKLEQLLGVTRRALQQFSCRITNFRILRELDESPPTAIQVTFTNAPIDTQVPQERPGRILTRDARRQAIQYRDAIVAHTTENETAWINGKVAKENRAWGIVNTGLEKMSRRFSAVLPSGQSLDQYLAENLPTPHDNIGIEIGGISSNFFRELRAAMPGYFSKSFGISLTDLRLTFPNKAEILANDSEHGHAVITGNIFSDETKGKILQELDGKQPTFILQSMIGGHLTFPDDPYLLGDEVNFWYRLLAPKGVMLMQIPRILAPYTRRWAGEINQQNHALTGRMHLYAGASEDSGGLLALQKLPGAPKNMPLVSPRDMLQFRHRYGYDLRPPKQHDTLY